MSKQKILRFLSLPAALALLAVLALLGGCGVKRPEPESVSLTPESLTLQVGERALLSGTILPEEVRQSKLTWLSSDPEVASVAAGEVTGLSAGQAVIVASTDNGKVGTCTVRVWDPAEDGVTLSQTRLSLTAGEGAVLTAESSSGLPLFWVSSDPGIVTVEDGALFGVSEGRAFVMAWANSGALAVCEVEVTADPELSPFLFTWLSPERCRIDGVKDPLVRTLVLPDRVTEVARGALSACTALESLTLPFAGQYADGSGETSGSFLFDGTWPESLRELIFTGPSVPASAFVDAPFARVVLTDAESIGNRAFYRCLDLTEVDLPDSLKTLGESAFFGCEGLLRVFFGEGLERIGDYTFFECGELWTLSLPDSIREIGDGAFCRCAALQEIDLPKGLEQIGANAFRGCASLAEVDLPDSLTRLGMLAFMDCSALERVTVPGGIRDLAPGTFCRAGLKQAILSEGVETIALAAFYDCTALESLTLPASLTSVANDAFEDCTALSAVYISDLAAWEAIAFGNETSDPLYYGAKLYLNGLPFDCINLPDTLVGLGTNAFIYNVSMRNVRIPASLKTVWAALPEDLLGDPARAAGELTAYADWSFLRKISGEDL